MCVPVLAMEEEQKRGGVMQPEPPDEFDRETAKWLMILMLILALVLCIKG